MNELRMIIQREARRLLDTGQADLIIGYTKGPTPWSSAPVFVFKREDCLELTISSFCTQNLAVFLPRIEARVGIVAKPCDVRTIVEMIRENQIPREMVKIISFRCPGMLNPKKLEEKGVSPEVWGMVNAKEHPDALYDWCKMCVWRMPPDKDVVGEPRFLYQQPDYPLPEDMSTLADHLEKKTDEERWEFWQGEFARCIRCRACMKSCPVYYGGGDHFDRDAGTTGENTAEENMKIHLSFVYSLAGKCTLCGACESACPVEIPLTALHIPIYRYTRDVYGYEPGLSYTEVSPYFVAEPMPAGEGK
ncbi:MAG: 4Fe-4S dicluster domain-containing protein [bacterium JZ-2024 1]